MMDFDAEPWDSTCEAEGARRAHSSLNPFSYVRPLGAT